jgi:hypothetical protein
MSVPILSGYRIITTYHHVPELGGWSLDSADEGCGYGYICDSCGTMRDTFKRLDFFSERFLLAYCVNCYDFKIRPQLIKAIQQERGLEAAVAWVKMADEEAALVREIKKRWQVSIYERYLEMKEAAGQREPYQGVRLNEDYEEEGEDYEDYESDDEIDSCDLCTGMMRRSVGCDCLWRR